MPELDFLDLNDFIAYPLVTDDPRTFVGSGSLPRRGISDAGFLLGLDSGFDVAADDVHLYSVEVTATEVIFDFRCSALEMLGYRWLFAFQSTAELGCTAYTMPETIAGAIPDPERGTGYLTIGNLEELLALGVGVYILAGTLRVEPARLQSLIDTYARSVIPANTARLCPPQCCASSSSGSSDSSSSSSSGLVDTAYVYGGALLGDVKFKEGFNSRITVKPANNLIEFDAQVGAGAGPACEDVIIDENGFHQGETCLDCDAFVRSLNGQVSEDGRLKLTGLRGVKVVPDPVNHKLTVTVDPRSVCVSSSSSA
jgi:hypothetical protein